MDGFLRRVSLPLARVAGWRFFKPAVFIGCAIPLALLGYRFYLAFTGQDPNALGPDPTKALLHGTGQDALILLLLSLSMTPLRRIFGINKLQSVRRMIGVWSFTYAAVHLSVYLLFDQLCYSAATCQWSAVWQDILKRRFIFVGQFAFLCLLLLALTSTMGWQRRLRKNWTRLHRLAYVAGIAAVVHFIWIQKSDIREPLRYGAVLAVLLGIRVYYALKKRTVQVPQVPRVPQVP